MDSVIFCIGVLVSFVILVLIELIPKRNIENKIKSIKERTEPEEFELLDMLFIPNIGHERTYLRVVPIIKLLSDGKIYCMANGYSNYQVYYRCETSAFANSVSKITIRNKVSNEKNAEIKVGDIGVCYMENIKPYELKCRTVEFLYFEKLIKYEEPMYCGTLKENKSIYSGKFCNINENIDVIMLLRNLNSFEGVIEFKANNDSEKAIEYI